MLKTYIFQGFSRFKLKSIFVRYVFFMMLIRGDDDFGGHDDDDDDYENDEEDDNDDDQMMMIINAPCWKVSIFRMFSLPVALPVPESWFYCSHCSHSTVKSRNISICKVSAIRSQQTIPWGRGGESRNPETWIIYIYIFV